MLHTTDDSIPSPAEFSRPLCVRVGSKAKRFEFTLDIWGLILKITFLLSQLFHLLGFLCVSYVFLVCFMCAS